MNDALERVEDELAISVARDSAYSSSKDIETVCRMARRSLLTELERLRTIHENGLCQDWLEDCGYARVTFEKFLELVDEQVEMDRQEGTPEFIEELKDALKDTAFRVINPNGSLAAREVHRLETERSEG